MTSEIENYSATSSFNDAPIKISSEDLLNRDNFANFIVQEILSLNTSEGYVISITGPWGSGKTSIFNLIKGKEDLEEYIFIDYNPWMISGVDTLIHGLFREINSKLRKKGRKWGKVADNINNYVDLLEPLATLPTVGGGISILLSVNKSVKKFRKMREKSLEEQKSQVSEDLRGLEKPIIVFIDDIDRLEKNEIREIFKLVRVTANFPNIIYILAFDRIYVESALSEYAPQGRAYLEKIIQMNFEVPIASYNVVENIFVQTLNSIVGSVPRVKFSPDLWPEVMGKIVMPFLRNIRDAKRIINSLKPVIKAIDGQVELNDIVALETIRIFCPDVFSKIIEERSFITLGSSNGRRFNRLSQELIELSVNKILNTSGRHNKEVESILYYIFPASRNGTNNQYMEYHPSVIDEFFHDRRVAHADIFSLYLERINNENINTLILAEDIYRHIEDSETFVRFIGELDTQKCAQVIKQMGAINDPSVSPNGIVNATVTFLNILPTVIENDINNPFSSERSKILTAVSNFLIRANSDSDIKRIIDEIFLHVNNLSSKRELVMKLTKQNELYGLDLEYISDIQNRLKEEIDNTSPDKLTEEWALLRLLLYPIPLVEEFDPEEIPAAASPLFHRSLIKSGLAYDSSGINNKALAWDTLLKVYKSEEKIGEAVMMIKDLNNAEDEELIQLINKYLEGWRPDF